MVATFGFSSSDEEESDEEDEADDEAALLFLFLFRFLAGFARAGAIVVVKSENLKGLKIRLSHGVRGQTAVYGSQNLPSSRSACFELYPTSNMPSPIVGILGKCESTELCHFSCKTLMCSPDLSERFSMVTYHDTRQGAVN